MGKEALPSLCPRGFRFQSFRYVSHLPCDGLSSPWLISCVHEIVVILRDLVVNSCLLA